MKRIICFVLAIVCLSLSLTSCSDKMIMDGSGLTHSKTGITYKYVLDICYQPIHYAEEPYVSWEYNDIKVDYYEIKGLDPSEWLYCPERGELICSTNEILPSLSDFQANGAFICIESERPYSIYEIEDTELVNKIIDRYFDENTPSYSTIYASSNYTLKFVSDKYPQFYYSIVISADVEGVYIHDRMNGKYIDLGDLLDEYNLYEYQDENA